MLYTLVVFVALFIITTLCAGYFYVQHEEYRTRYLNLEQGMNDMASSTEQSNVTQIIGSRHDRATYLGTMLDHHNQAMALIMGQPVETQTSVETYMELANTNAEKAVEKAKSLMPLDVMDPNTGLVNVVDRLCSTIETLQQKQVNLEKTIEDLNASVVVIDQTSKNTIQVNTQEKDNYHEKLQDAERSLEQLTAQSQEEYQTYERNSRARLDQQMAYSQTLESQLEQTQEQLDQVQSRMENAMTLVRETEPVPDRNIPLLAYDGMITLVDDPSSVVYINLGKTDHIYQGLTFAVYDRGSKVPEHGKGKAEIKVFQISEKMAKAHIVSRDPKNPITTNDVIMNSIWDRDKGKHIVIAGHFDLDMNGSIDSEAIERIGHLVKDWGGIVEQEITHYTDFVIMGKAPVVPRKPAFDDLDDDPLAEERYNKAQKSLDQYNEIAQQAKDLMIPIYPYETFLYLTGYKGQVQFASAFK